MWDRIHKPIRYKTTVCLKKYYIVRIIQPCSCLTERGTYFLEIDAQFTRDNVSMKLSETCNLIPLHWLRFGKIAKLGATLTACMTSSSVGCPFTSTRHCKSLGTVRVHNRHSKRQNSVNQINSGAMRRCSSAGRLCQAHIQNAALWNAECDCACVIVIVRSTYLYDKYDTLPPFCKRNVRITKLGNISS